MKNKIATIGIIIATLILAGVAVFTAVRLYQLRKEAVAPTAPTSKPKAQEVPIACTALTFNLTVTPTPAACNQSCNNTVHPPIPCQQDLVCHTSSTLLGAPGLCRNPNCINDTDCVCETSTPTPTATPTATPMPTATPTNPPGEPNSCNGTCGSNYNCKSDLFCYGGFCRNPSCPTQTNCTCGIAATTTPRPTGTTAIAEEPSLPNAGTSLPTILGIGIGALLLIGAILLAL